MIVVSEIMVVVAPIRTIETVVSPRADPRIIHIIVPIVVVIDIIDVQFRTVLQIDIHIAVIGNMCGEIGVVETTDTLGILVFFVIVQTDKYRVLRLTADSDRRCGCGLVATTVVFVHVTDSGPGRRRFGGHRDSLGFCVLLLDELGMIIRIIAV